MMNSDNKDPLILANKIAEWVEVDPDRQILTFVSIGPQGDYVEQHRSYRELWDNGQRVAQLLRQAGMKKGDAFALLMQNHAEFVDVMVASSIVGTVFVPVDPRTRGAKLRYMLEFAGCRGVLCADYCMGSVAELRGTLPDIDWVWAISDQEPSKRGPLVGGAVWLDSMLEGSVPDLPIAVTDSAEPMQMLYTSGTTGDPKAILAPYARYGGIAMLGPVLNMTDEDRPYTGLSLTHANAQLITLGIVLYSGTPGVVSRKFTKSRLWDILRHYGCTVFNLLGGMTTAIYSEPVKENDGENPVRFVLSAGMPEAIWQEFSDRFHVDIYEFYGTAEGGLLLNPPGTGPVGSVGKPPPTMDARILGDGDQELPAGEMGEMVFRNADGTPIVVEYYKNPEASAEKTRGGWFRSGDIGWRDEEGWFYFSHRAGTGIRRHGDFINVAFVERALARHPDVDDIFIYGIPAASGAPGEKDMVAAIVLKDPDRFDADEIFRYLEGELDANAVPSYLQVLPEIPKTASEKPQARFCEELLERQPECTFTRGIN
jgi:crotonobetaine/carnitine-CoA ligase